MNKLMLLVSTFVVSSHSFATYTTTGTTAGISVNAGSATTVYYTAPTDGSSNTGYPSITHNFTGDWDFTFNTDNSVNFTGNLYLGDYETQTNVTGFPVIDGHQTFVGVNQTVSGMGIFDNISNTFSYSLATGDANSSIASNQTQTSASCSNGKTSIFGNVCGTWENTTAAWEGLTLNFIFSEDLNTFDGTITAIERSGSGLTANTTTVSFNVNGINDVSEVPVPAAIWLFGSSLIGLAGLKRKRAE